MKIISLRIAFDHSQERPVADGAGRNVNGCSGRMVQKEGLRSLDRPECIGELDTDIERWTAARLDLNECLGPGRLHVGGSLKRALRRELKEEIPAVLIFVGRIADDTGMGAQRRKVGLRRRTERFF